MEPYKYKGRVHYVSPVQSFQSGFAKRTLVLEEEGNSKYQNYAAFEFTRSKDGTKDATKLLDRVCPGELVEVTFRLDANESKSKPGAWFPSNRALKLERLERAEAKAPEIPLIPSATSTSGACEEDDIPF